MTPAKVAVLYSSGYGHTELLAEHIAQGAKELAETKTIDVCERFDFKELHKMDALVFGSPTYMGSVSAEFKAFMDSTSSFWTDKLWNNKIAAGFTVGTCPSGDKATTLLQLVTFAAQHGMIWVGQSELGDRFANTTDQRNLNGFWVGLGAMSVADKSQKIAAGDLLTARIFGRRIAEVTEKFKHA